MTMPTALSLTPIAADVSVAGQLEPVAMAEVARLGFRSVVNNRPDFEGGDSQPTSAAVEAAAQAAGLVYRHLPVAGGYQSPDEIAAFGRLISELPRPVLCFCRSGARSTKLYLASGAN
jgi:uncharacterized protein (TIGR01244 family)